MKLYRKRKNNTKLTYSQLIDSVKNTWEYFFRNDYFVNKLKVTIQENTRHTDLNKAFTDNSKNLLTIALHFNPFPIDESNLSFQFSGDCIFDFIEYMYHMISAPINGYWFEDTTDSGFNYSEYRYEKFDEAKGQREFIEKVNSYLPYYKEGYELLETGEIVLLESELKSILDQEIPNVNIDRFEDIPIKVQESIAKFRQRNGILDLRKDALKGLTDVNERLREFIKDKKILNGTEVQLLFNIFGETADKFYIRHDNKKQVRDYDTIFLSMLFHIYLSTIHASIRIINQFQNFKK